MVITRIDPWTGESLQLGLLPESILLTGPNGHIYGYWPGDEFMLLADHAFESGIILFHLNSSHLLDTRMMEFTPIPVADKGTSTPPLAMEGKVYFFNPGLEVEDQTTGEVSTVHNGDVLVYDMGEGSVTVLGGILPESWEEVIPLAFGDDFLLYRPGVDEGENITFLRCAIVELGGIDLAVPLSMVSILLLSMAIVSFAKRD